VQRPSTAYPHPARVQPLWDRVDANRWRLVRYLALFCALSATFIGIALWATQWALFIFSGGTEWYGRWAAASLAGGLAAPWLAGLLLSVAYVAWALRRSERWLIRRLGLEFVPKGVRLDSKFAVKDMAIAAGMPVAPAFYEMPGTGVNALAFAPIGRRPIIAVTTGLAEKLSVDHQRAIYANLIARIVTGDAMVASALSALMAPVEAWRDWRLRAEFEATTGGSDVYETMLYGHVSRDTQQQADDASGIELLLLLTPLGIPLVILGEIVAATYRRSQLTASEKGDADGMLLLKDPVSMLGALEDCVARNNGVASTSDGLGTLFYCWPGDATDDEDDPEWKRVGRLREVLGVEGAVLDDAPLPESAVAPLPPRLEGGGSR
jgi:Zn-dependent protease with chaperone function